MSTGTTGYAVTVVFRVQPARRDAFRAAILANAASSLANESGCTVFDVCESADRSEVFLYEIYDDEAAFKAHLATPHYLRFKELVTEWVVHKRVVPYHRLSQET